MAKAMIPANWPYSLEPGLREVFYTGMSEKPMVYSEVFKVLTSGQAVERDLALSGMGIWGAVPDGTPITKDEMEEIARIAYTHVTYKKSFAVTKDLIEDELYGSINEGITLLGRGARARIETDAAGVFNNAFAGGGAMPDGGQLCADARALVNSTDTNDNRGTAALSYDSLQARITVMNGQLDDGGIMINAQPDTLVVPTALGWTAMDLLKTTSGAPETAENSYNVFNSYGMKLIVWPYLTDANNWFLIDSKLARLKFYDRVPVAFEIDQINGTSSAEYMGRMRFSVGASDYRGIDGSIVAD